MQYICLETYIPLLLFINSFCVYRNVIACSGMDCAVPSPCRPSPEPCTHAGRMRGNSLFLKNIICKNNFHSLIYCLIKK